MWLVEWQGGLLTQGTYVCVCDVVPCRLAALHGQVPGAEAGLATLVQKERG